MLKRLAIAGSTGSIGQQALEIVKNNRGNFEVVALMANSSAYDLIAQAKEFQPKIVAIMDDAHYQTVRQALDSSYGVYSGNDAIEAIVDGADIVLNAIVGFAGLPVTVKTLEKNKVLALANKESFIASGELISELVSFKNQILPLDSEHSAIFQCLKQEDTKDVSKLFITSSGGPFRGYNLDQLKHVTVKDALQHPTWKMGPKITIDSSTLMNKGLEIIEAHFLFGVAYDDIKVVIHPQSIVHSMVQFKDGSTLAQLSYPDMRVPIAYALYFPERSPTSYAAVDFTQGVNLSFEAPDNSVFKALDLAYHAGKTGGCCPTWLNAANEVAVSAFLEGKISWLAIAEIVEKTLINYDHQRQESLDTIIAADQRARKIATELLNQLSA